MSVDKQTHERNGGMSNKVKLALGAASLFLFIVGLKRTFKADDSPAGPLVRDDPTQADPPTDRTGSERTRDH